MVAHVISIVKIWYIYILIWYKYICRAPVHSPHIVVQTGSTGRDRWRRISWMSHVRAAPHLLSSQYKFLIWLIFLFRYYFVRNWVTERRGDGAMRRWGDEAMRRWKYDFFFVNFLSVSIFVKWWNSYKCSFPLIFGYNFFFILFI